MFPGKRTDLLIQITVVYEFVPITKTVLDHKLILNLQ